MVFFLNLVAAISSWNRCWSWRFNHRCPLESTEFVSRFPPNSIWPSFILSIRAEDSRQTDMWFNHHWLPFWERQWISSPSHSIRGVGICLESLSKLSLSLINGIIKDGIYFLFQRFNWTTTGKNNFFNFIDLNWKAKFVWHMTLTILVFAYKCLVTAMLINAYHDGLVSFGAFCQVY